MVLRRETVVGSLSVTLLETVFASCRRFGGDILPMMRVQGRRLSMWVEQ